VETAVCNYYQDADQCHRRARACSTAVHGDRRGSWARFLLYRPLRRL
jgi:hypothetical protein